MEQRPRSGGRPVRYIELMVRDTHALFNTLDPSPFKEKDLDDDAEAFIVGWAREFPPDVQPALRIHVKEYPANDPTPMIAESIHNYFGYRARLIDMEFRQLMRQARTSLLIGLSFLAGCFFTSRYLLAAELGTWGGLLRESLTIAGWVAMWRPMQLYLYDWWPLKRRGRIYRKLGQAPVEVVPPDRT